MIFDHKPIWRLRNWFIWFVPLLVLIALFRTDPDANAATTFIYLLKAATGFFFAVALAHLGMRYLHDYPEADTRSLFGMVHGEDAIKAKAAGLALIAKAIFFLALLFASASAVKAQDVRTFVPERCFHNLLYLKAAQQKHWPDHPDRATLAALAEHESCVTLQSSRCCSPTAQLKNAREEGAGIPELTRTYRADGSLRFDALAELRELHPVLRELTWENVYQRPDLQNAALVLKSQDNYRYFLRFVTDKGAALDFGDGGYNAGNGRIQADRRACAIAARCDPGQWFGNVERYCTASRVALYGARSACDIYHQHVEDVRRVRAPKYRGLMT